MGTEVKVHKVVDCCEQSVTKLPNSFTADLELCLVKPFPGLIGASVQFDLDPGKILAMGKDH